MIYIGDFFTSDPDIMYSHRPVHLIERVGRVSPPLRVWLLLIQRCDLHRVAVGQLPPLSPP